MLRGGPNDIPLGQRPQWIELLPTLSEDILTPAPCVETTQTVSVALLTGGIDRHYACGLALSLAARDVKLEVIGNDAVNCPVLHNPPNLQFVDVWPGGSGNARLLTKCARIMRHYVSLIRYAAVAHPDVFHILWNSKIQLFDRTLLMLYFRALGKKVTLTAHNVNQGRRDGKDSFLNRLSLRIQYRLCNHIFVHTEKMKKELVEDFGVSERGITVIRHPLNIALPQTELIAAEAKFRLGIREDEKTMLCFGRIKPYKGIEHLLAAFKRIIARDSKYRLVVAGELQKGNEAYLSMLKQSVEREMEEGQVLFKTEFIPDHEIEAYFKAADVLVLPYNEIFQSGVLFLGYSFGLPVIATDVGSFREEIVEGQTGYVCRPSDAADLAVTIETYFASDLYRRGNTRRQEIRDYAEIHHSWGAVADRTRNVYAQILKRSSHEARSDAA